LDAHKLNRISAAGVLVTLGIIFGDIGTSPLYVLKAIIGEGNVINRDLVYGGISCIFWTLTLQTTIKYVIITLRADNKGEGGIFSLYTLVRRKAKWLMLPAIIGGCTLLADGIITPPISVASAIEGLQLKYPDIQTVPIVIVIITILFLFQQFGSNFVGKAFGPIMFLWFTMLGVVGFSQITMHVDILKAVNPYFAYDTLINNPSGFWILGAVFLCTTGAEALYSDLGHCGRANIRVSWAFVKICLLLNYFGQGAWLVTNSGSVMDSNPFYSIMPEWFLIYGIGLATLATIIASQALISGSFTLISEAVRLNFWPKVKINYPTDAKGQLYVPSINWLLWFGCCSVVLYFQESTHMEAAYGLSITLTMLMTTILLMVYLLTRKFSYWLVGVLLAIYATIELSFLVANLSKFTHGGWVTILIGGVLFTIMWSWINARKIRNRYLRFSELDDYLPILKELSADQSVPKYASQLVYLTGSNFTSEIEAKIMYSIFQKQPKRADVYWFVHVDVEDEPYKTEYKVVHLVPGNVIRIEFKLGFRIEQKINVLFRKVVEDLVKNNEVDIVSRYESLHKHNITGDFKFIVLEKKLSADNSLPLYERIIMQIYFLLKKLSLSEEKGFGLDLSFVTIEQVPLLLSQTKNYELKRVGV
jgi:KUP system potassium uptake protein